jgi:thiol-disulfide isomerase/thioredoxin
VKRSTWFVWGGLLAVVIVAVLAATAFGGSDGGGSTASGGAGSRGNGAAHEQAPVHVDGESLPTFVQSQDDPAVGLPVPKVTGVSVFDGSPVALEPTGKPQAFVFLAHWCPHCQAEVPRLVALAKAGKLAGIDVIAIATGTSPGANNYPPSAWLKREKWPFPVLADSTGFSALHAYGVSAFPGFVLVDANGKVAGRSTGEVSDADVIANVKALAAGRPLPLLESGASSSAS